MRYGHAVLAGVLCLAGTMGAAAASEATTPPIVLGYYPSWESGLPPASINYSQFTHLCHAFVTADTSGTVKTEGNLPSRELTQHAHKAGVKVLLSLGGMDSGNYFGTMCKDPVAYRRFIDGVMALVIDNGYDGVDIDWEFTKNADDMKALTAMALTFREELNRKRPGSLVTAAFSGSEWAGRWVDGPALLEAMDFVCVMTYDMHGPWSDHAGFNSALRSDPADRDACRKTSVVGQMAHWTDQKKWPKNKLLVGIPCYGRGFRVTEWYQPLKKGEKSVYPYVPFRKIGDMLNQGWTRSWNEPAQVPWLQKPGIGELITYDDERSAAAKASWGAEQGFGGVFFWEISQDFTAGSHALVKAASEAWKR